MAGTAVPVEVFTNNPSTTVAASGYQGGAATGDAPAALTAETWTVTSSATFPAASNAATPPTQFHIADPAAASEIMLVTNISGTTWSITRGAEGTTPVTHAAGATLQQTVTAAALSLLNPANGEFFGNVSAPAWPLNGAWLHALSGSLRSVNTDGLTYPVGEQRIVTTTSTVGTTGTTAQNVTGLSAAIGVGKYFLELRVPYEATTTVGSTNTFGFASGSAPTVTALAMASYIQNGQTTAELSTSAYVTSFSAAMWTTPTHIGTTATGPCMAHLWGTLTTSVAGTLQVCFTNATSADNINVLAGALMKVSPNN